MQNKKNQGTKHSQNRLVALLQRDYLTARQVARRLRCSRIHAYRQIHRLEAAGFVLRSKLIRERATGPMAAAYRIA